MCWYSSNYLLKKPLSEILPKYQTFSVHLTFQANVILGGRVGEWDLMCIDSIELIIQFLLKNKVQILKRFESVEH